MKVRLLSPAPTIERLVMDYDEKREKLISLISQQIDELGLSQSQIYNLSHALYSLCELRLTKDDIDSISTEQAIQIFSLFMLLQKNNWIFPEELKM